jgi:hypothetical protein
MNDELAKKCHFSLYPRHIQFLDNINEDSRSKALQIVIDSIINGEEQTQRKKILDNSILYISLGFVLFSFVFTTHNPFIYIIGLCLGIFLITYGGIGGVQHALRRTNNYK